MSDIGDSFAVPIVQHPRFVLIAPALFVGGGLVLANLLWFGARWLKLSRTTGLVVALLCFLVSIPFAIWVAHTQRGELRIEGRDLVRQTRGRSELRLSLDTASWTPAVWQRGMPATMTVGLVIVVDDGSERLSIGAADPMLASHPFNESATVSAVPPSVRISSENLLKLIDQLAANGVHKALGG